MSIQPELDKIKDDFMNNLVNGGVEACRAMVGDLEQISEYTAAVSSGTGELDAETIAAQNELLAEDVRARIAMTRGATLDSITAMTQHSFAAFLLGVVEDSNTEPRG